jgi:hypothetical protein
MPASRIVDIIGGFLLDFGSWILDFNSGVLMRKFIVLLLALAISASFAFAQCGGCAGAKSGCAGAAKASYSDARTMPACAPSQVHDFHKVLMPFMEARTTQETIYIRDNARALYDAARVVPKSKACCEAFNKKAFKRSAKDLVNACKQLEKMSKDQKVRDEAVLAQMQVVENNFAALSNACQ